MSRLATPIRLLLIPLLAFGGFQASRWRPSTPGAAIRVISDPRQRIIPRVDLDDTTYGVALDYLNDLSGLKIIVDWAGLQKLEVTPQTPLHIDLHLKNVRLGQVLDAVTSSYVEPHPTFDSYVWTGFQPADGLLVFTLHHNGTEWEPVETRAHEVGDILDGLRVADLIEPDTRDAHWLTRTPAERLSLLLTTSRKAELWDGPDPLEFHGKLFITQTEESHEKTRHSLSVIRDMTRGKIPVEEK